MKIIKQIIFLIFLINSLCAYCGNIIVGVGKFVPPFSSVDTSNHYFGFCIDLINEVCKRMKETCEYKSIVEVGIENALNKGTVDVSLTPTPIPTTPYPGYIFSIPYMTSNGQFVTSNPDIETIADLKGKKIGTLDEAHLDQILQHYTAPEDIKKYKHINDLIQALMDKSVDATLINVNVYKYLMSNQLVNVQPIGKPINLGNGYGLLALDKNSELISRINKALLDIVNDGTYEKIYIKYFGK